MIAELKPQLIEALVEALTNIYWYKDQAKSFIVSCIGDPNLIQVVSWDQTKRQSIRNLITYLMKKGQPGEKAIFRLVQSVCEMNEFSHLAILEDGKDKAAKAKNAVDLLVKVSKFTTSNESQVSFLETQARESESKSVIDRTINEIQQDYFKLINNKNFQERGRQLEKIMKRIFDAFDLDPRASFSISGEQIDGAFSLDGTEYIFEAKWFSDPCERGELDVFAGKLSRKLENTLGLMLSINSFSHNAIELHSRRRSNFLLITGADLNAVLDRRISLVDMLRRKKKHAAHTGEILIEFHQF
jgi:hypothetical protein